MNGPQDRFEKATTTHDRTDPERIAPDRGVGHPADGLPRHAAGCAADGAAHGEAAVADLVRYWRSLQSQGDVPRRAQVDPRSIAPLLEAALIAERIAPGLARLRIAGTHLSDLMGMEVRGMPLSAFLAPADRPQLADALTELFERPAMIDLALHARGGWGRGALTGRLVLLPLRSDLGDISRALGVLVSHGAIGRGPRRFNITAQRTTALARPLCGASAAAPVPGNGRAGPGPRHPAERPYLRLVE